MTSGTGQVGCPCLQSPFATCRGALALEDGLGSRRRGPLAPAGRSLARRGRGADRIGSGGSWRGGRKRRGGLVVHGQTCPARPLERRLRRRRGVSLGHPLPFLDGTGSSCPDAGRGRCFPNAPPLALAGHFAARLAHNGLFVVGRRNRIPCGRRWCRWHGRRWCRWGEREGRHRWGRWKLSGGGWRQGRGERRGRGWRGWPGRYVGRQHGGFGPGGRGRLTLVCSWFTGGLCLSWLVRPWRPGLPA
jgi:hypothetical protein